MSRKMHFAYLVEELSFSTTIYNEDSLSYWVFSSKPINVQWAQLLQNTSCSLLEWGPAFIQWSLPKLRETPQGDIHILLWATLRFSFDLEISLKWESKFSFSINFAHQLSQDAVEKVTSILFSRT